MKVAVEGCAHGELDKIYEALEHLQASNNVEVDLLIICGDFQSVRNNDDLQCMAVPRKYQKLNSFYKYYSGAKVAPVLTIFIGGNHEASNFLSELSYGGWVCPNIYYMGNANVVNVGGLRIAGLSGIYKGQDYLKGHFELPPYNESTKRSVYHIRNIDVFRLKQIKQPIDIFISHDWPRGIYNFGNKAELLRWKPFFKDEMNQNRLGSRPGEELLNKLKPSYWFAAHLHCKFAAVVPHDSNGEKSVTKFLALDKCLPKRKFLHIVEIPKESGESLSIHYDPEWLGILRSTNHLLNITRNQTYMPGPGCSQRWDFSATDEELNAVRERFDDDFIVPENFQHTAPPLLITSSPQTSNHAPKLFINSQTTAFCKLLGISDPFASLINESPNKSSDVMEFSFVEDLNVTASSQKSIDPDGGSVSDEDDISDMDANVSGSAFQEDFPFFIDTKGCSPQVDVKKRPSFESPASLPPEYDKSFLLSNFPEYKEKTESETSGKVNTSITTDDGCSPTKKFKRRNQAMYMNDDS